MNITASCYSILYCTFIFLVSPQVSATAMRFTGALVAEPCIIAPGDETEELDFGTILDKDLYYHQRSAKKPFTLTLTSCSLDIAKTVAVTFSGQESEELAGYLAMNKASSAKGIALGMETLSGQPILLNKVAPPISLENGRTLITLQAFIEGEPAAIRDRTIINGEFNAVATFSLNYQ